MSPVEQGDQILLKARIKARDGEHAMGLAVARARTARDASMIALAGVLIGVIVSNSVLSLIFAGLCVAIYFVLFRLQRASEASCFAAGYLEGEYHEVKVWNVAMHRALDSEGERPQGARAKTTH